MTLLREQIHLTCLSVVILIGYLIGVYQTDKSLYGLDRGRRRGTVHLSKYVREWFVLYDNKRQNRTFIVTIINNILVWIIFVVQFVFSMIATTDELFYYASQFVFWSAGIYAGYTFLVLVIYSSQRKRR